MTDKKEAAAALRGKLDFRVHEAARILGVHRSMIYHYIKDGRLKRNGRGWITKESLLEMVR